MAMIRYFHSRRRILSRLRRCGAGIELFLLPLRLFPLADFFPSLIHERNMAEAFAFALVQAYLLAAAAEALALVLSGTGAFGGRSAGTLAAAGILAAFALPFAFVESTADVLFNGGDDGRAGAWIRSL